MDPNAHEPKTRRKRVARGGSAAAVAGTVQPLAHAAAAAAASLVVASSQQLVFPTPTKRMKKNRPQHHAQGRCMVCKKPTTHVCRDCQRHQPNPDLKQYWICNKAGKECMGAHIIAKHPLSIKQQGK